MALSTSWIKSNSSFLPGSLYAPSPLGPPSYNTPIIPCHIKKQTQS